MTTDMHLFTKEYYEDGIRKHISGYENSTWQPTILIPEALDIQNYFVFDNCVDYGCAKGFLVHALRILGSKAYGEDMSEYAIENNYNYVPESQFAVCDVDGIIDFYSKPPSLRHHACHYCKYAIQNELIDDVLTDTIHNDFA